MYVIFIRSNKCTSNNLIGKHSPALHRVRVGPKRGGEGVWPNGNGMEAAML